MFLTQGQALGQFLHPQGGGTIAFKIFFFEGLNYELTAN
jgi:hypothetical protein